MWIGKVILHIILYLYLILSWGNVARISYDWYILSQFKDLPHFDTIQFGGFIIFVSVMKGIYIDFIKKEFKDDYFVQYTMMILLPWLFWLFSYIFHSLYF